MISSKISKAARAGRSLVGGVAFAIAAVVTLAASSAALAQPKSNLPGCTSFSSFSFDSSTNTLQVNNCSTSVVQPVTPVVTPINAQSIYSIATATTTATAGTPMTIVIARSGGNLAEQLDMSIGANALTGWSFNGATVAGTLQQLPFALGEMSRSLNFTPGTTAGMLGISLGAVASTVGSVASGTLLINVSAPAGAAPLPGCSTTATKNEIFQMSNQKVVMSLRAGETGAVAFTPSATSIQMYLSSSETVNTPPDADHEIAISTCPGDFTPIYPCSYQANYVGNSLQGKVGAGPAYQCALQVGTTYYMNVRHVKLRDPSNWKGVAPQNSCLNPPQYTNGACEVRLQNTGL